jgi:hypothetical protein
MSEVRPPPAAAEVPLINRSLRTAVIPRPPSTTTTSATRHRRRVKTARKTEHHSTVQLKAPA